MSNCQVELRDLAHQLAEKGPEAVDGELRALAGVAAAAGVEPALLAALCDRAAPAVVRQRAFARVAAQLDTSGTPASIDVQSPGESPCVPPRTEARPGDEGPDAPDGGRRPAESVTG